MNAHSKTYQYNSLASSILLIEDNPMDIDFSLQAFEENKITNPVVIWRDGEEALAFVNAHFIPEDPDLSILVLLDLVLPKVSGIEFLSQARLHPVWKNIPFVILTTSQQSSDISSAYELGVNSYIVKPVNFAAFAKVVKHIKAYWLLINEPPFADPRRN